ncbi:MAG: glycosyltransferase family 2 protein [Cyanobacteriota bacterium]|nr:glycosyltransferase family 2 protein [Cyanobacteriota bacterium]
MTATPCEIQLSVALVTRNRPDSLERCLHSLRSQSIQPFEIVISDDSDPSVAPYTEKVARACQCRYLPGPRRGLYANRNFSALACRGTHIRTMDDDHILPEGHLEQCYTAVAADPDSIWTTGEVGYVNGSYYAESATAHQLCPSGVGEGVKDLDNNWAIADGSTIYPRTVFDRGYRMIEDYRYGSSYLEFGAYLYYHGFRSRCVRNAYVEHYADENTINRTQPEAVASYFYASLCFNFYFRRNYILLTKYCLLYSTRLAQHQPLRRFLPELARKVKQRWQT